MDERETTISTEKSGKIQEFFKESWPTRPEDVITFYDKYACVYEDITKAVKGNGWELVTKEVAACFENENLKSKLILDAGAGTGLIGKELVKRGFKQIDALDPSNACLQEARKKKVYTDFYCCFITTEVTPGIKENKYDAVVSGGCFTVGNIQIEALEELIRITKVGGWIVFTLNDPNFEMNYMQGLERFMKEKKVELVSMRLFPYKQDNEKRNVYAYLIRLKVL